MVERGVRIGIIEYHFLMHQVQKFKVTLMKQTKG